MTTPVAELERFLEARMKEEFLRGNIQPTEDGQIVKTNAENPGTDIEGSPYAEIQVLEDVAHLSLREIAELILASQKQ